MEDDTLLTLNEAADRLRCSYRTLLRLIASGAIPVVEIGNRRRFILTSDVADYLTPVGVA